MGQHRHNPNCKLAAEGKLPPKPRRKSKRERERELAALMWRALIEKVPATASVLAALEDAQ